MVFTMACFTMNMSCNQYTVREVELMLCKKQKTKLCGEMGAMVSPIDPPYVT